MGSCCTGKKTIKKSQDITLAVSKAIEKGTKRTSQTKPKAAYWVGDLKITPS